MRLDPAGVRPGDAAPRPAFQRPAHQRLLPRAQTGFWRRQAQPEYLRRRSRQQNRRRIAQAASRLLAAAEKYPRPQVGHFHGPHHRRRHHRQSAPRASRNVQAVIDLGSWPVLPIFKYLAQLGEIDRDELLHTFNLGVGMILVVPAKHVSRVETELKRKREKFYLIGRIERAVRGKPRIIYTGKLAL